MKDLTRIWELLELFNDLNRNEVKPSKIVGTGLTAPRKLAYVYICSRLTDEISKLND